MGKTVANAMSYERSGTTASKRKDVVRGMFREMELSELVFGSLGEFYRRYTTELLATALFSSWAMFIWVKLG